MTPTLANNLTDTANDIDISAGSAYADDGSNYLIALPVSSTKRVDANWSAGSGQGGLDTGSVVSSADPGTSYSFWLIANSSTGDVDALISASPTNPRMPPGFDKKKYIGSMIYTTSWKMFTQFGNWFIYTTKVATINNVTLGTLETAYTLPIPSGRRVLVKLNIRIVNPAGSVAVHLRSDVEMGQLPGFTDGPYATLALAAINQSMVNQVECWSSTARQILTVMHANSCTFGAAVVGWMDPDIDASGRMQPAMTSPVSLVGSRIDAICDCGDGVVIAAARDTLPGRIYRSTDYGRSFTLVGTATGSGNTSVLCVASDFAGNVYAILLNGDLWKSTDNGVTWAFKAQVTTSGGPCYGVVVAADGSVIVTDRKDAPGAIWRSTDGGCTFAKVLQEPGGSKGTYRVVTCRDGLVANSFTGIIYRSTDNGATWTATQTLTSSEVYGLCYCENGILLCGDLDAKVYRSVDDGVTWAQIAQVDGASDDIGYLGGGRVIYTTYTSKKRLYSSDNFGDQMRTLGRCPTVADDWADHVAVVNEPGKNSTLLVSSGKGYVFRVD